jgi:hypothetical protein
MKRLSLCRSRSDCCGQGTSRPGCPLYTARRPATRGQDPVRKTRAVQRGLEQMPKMPPALETLFPAPPMLKRGRRRPGPPTPVGKLSTSRGAEAQTGIPGLTALAEGAQQ